MTEAVLRTERLCKHFGGLAAVNDVSLEIVTDQIHAVIGPNGAGKTTLTSLLAGDLPCTSGRIVLDGEDIAGLSPDRISQRGCRRCSQGIEENQDSVQVQIFSRFKRLLKLRLLASD